MLLWINEFASKSIDYLTSPILYHASCDGLVMTIYHSIAIFADAFGTTAMAFMFIFLCCYYRNIFFSVTGVVNSYAVNLFQTVLNSSSKLIKALSNVVSLHTSRIMETMRNIFK